MKPIKLTYCLICLFLLVGCSEEERRVPIKPQTSFTFEVSVANSNNPAGRADISDENQIVDLDVVLFRREGRTDYFHSHINIPADNISTEGNEKKFVLDIPEDLLEIEAGARVMIFANCSNALKQFIEDNNITSETQTLRKVFHDSLYLSYDYPFIPDDPIPMCGILPGYVFNEGREEIPQFSVKLLRMYARIDVGVDMYNTYRGIRDKFQINNVYVIGQVGKGCIVRSFDEQIADPDASIPNVPLDPVRYASASQPYTYVEDPDERAMRKMAYVTESAPFTLDAELYRVRVGMIDGSISGVLHPGPGSYDLPFNGYFLVIEGTLEGQPECFYRVDFQSRYGDYLPIVRNNKYEINIVKVNDRGFNSLFDAQFYCPQQSTRADSGIEYEIKIN